MTADLVRSMALATRAVIAALAVGVVLGTVLVVTRSRPDPIEPPPSALMPVVISLPQVETVPGGALVERPLFWESRRPYTATGPVAEAVSVTGSDAIDKVKLVGVFASGIRAGVIVDVDGERRRIGLNEEIQGWALTGMTPGSATFAGIGRDGERVERRLVLEHASANGEAVPAAREHFAPATQTGDSLQQDHDSNDDRNDESSGNSQQERKSDE